MDHFRRSMADRPTLTSQCTRLADFKSRLQERKPVPNHMVKDPLYDKTKELVRDFQKKFAVAKQGLKPLYSSLFQTVLLT
jgi:hypothetical protein